MLFVRSDGVVGADAGGAGRDPGGGGGRVLAVGVCQAREVASAGGVPERRVIVGSVSE